MATNGILDITTEEYMGQDPEMQIDQNEMVEIISTLQIVGVPQDKHPEILEAFKEWKQTKNGTVDMFLEESFQLEPGTITKIKEQAQVAQGPQDMQSEEEMSIPPGSDDMREIMQSVGAPQRAAEGGIMTDRLGYAEGDFILPQPKPRYWEQGDGSMKGMMGANQSDPQYQAMGMNLDAGAPQIYPERRPEMPYIAEQQMQPFTGGVASVMPAGFNPITGQEGSFGQANNTGVQGMENVDMRVVMDFLMQMGMEPSQENIEKAIEALGVAAQYGQEEEAMDMRHGGRAGYGLGSFVKSITSAPKKIFKSIKKIAKSPLGKAAMMYLATAGASNYFAGAGRTGMSGSKWGAMDWLNPKNVASNVSTSWGKLPFGKDSATKEVLNYDSHIKNKYRADMEKFGGKDAGKFSEYMFNKSKDLYEGLDKVKDVAKPWYKDPWKMIPLMSAGAGLYTQANPGETNLDALNANRDEEVTEWDNWLAQIGKNPELYNFGKQTTMPYPDYAHGGRIGAEEGGIMNLDGMEKDFRNTGGFVDLGAKEKADDVPARLSVNEFVMTADAVRGAGDGDVDQGAERLQQTMKQLEQKGKRHKAAQGMFATSQRLGEVI